MENMKNVLKLKYKEMKLSKSMRVIDMSKQIIHVNNMDIEFVAYPSTLDGGEYGNILDILGSEKGYIINVVIPKFKDSNIRYIEITYTERFTIKRYLSNLQKIMDNFNTLFLDSLTVKLANQIQSDLPYRIIDKEVRKGGVYYRLQEYDSELIITVGRSDGMRGGLTIERHRGTMVDELAYIPNPSSLAETVSLTKILANIKLVEVMRRDSFGTKEQTT